MVQSVTKQTSNYPRAHIALTRNNGDSLSAVWPVTNLTGVAQQVRLRLMLGTSEVRTGNWFAAAVGATANPTLFKPEDGLAVWTIAGLSTGPNALTMRMENAVVGSQTIGLVADHVFTLTMPGWVIDPTKLVIS